MNKYYKNSDHEYIEEQMILTFLMTFNCIHTYYILTVWLWSRPCLLCSRNNHPRIVQFAITRRNHFSVIITYVVDNEFNYVTLQWCCRCKNWILYVLQLTTFILITWKLQPVAAVAWVNQRRITSLMYTKCNLYSASLIWIFWAVASSNFCVSCVQG